MKNMNLSKRMTRLSPSMTFAMNQKSNDLKAKGIDVVNMSLGEPDFDTPDHIKAAAVEALDKNFTHYTPVPGTVSLREAIAELPEDQREALILTQLEKVPYEEAARALGVSEGTVKSRVNRA